jgi:hypothetical protein
MNQQNRLIMLSKNKKLIFFTIQLLLAIIFNCSINHRIIAQTNPEAQISTNEIVQWINKFEDYNSPERIMKGTLDDKVNIEINNDNLIINSMIWMSSEPAIKVKETINIKEIIRIEDLKIVRDEYTFVDFIICSKKGSYKMECKRYDEYNYTRCSFEDKWIEKSGFCSFSLRFKFLNNIAEKETQRVYNALEALMSNYGATPEIGSKF